MYNSIVSLISSTSRGYGQRLASSQLKTFKTFKNINGLIIVSSIQQRQISSATTKTNPFKSTVTNNIQFQNVVFGSTYSHLLPLSSKAIVRAFNTRPDSRLADLEKEANLNKNDAQIQAEFMRELNKTNPEKVVKRYESGEFGKNEDTVAEYVKALVAINKLDGKFKDLLSNQGAPGGTRGNPLYVSQLAETGWLDWARTIASALFIGALVYLLFFRGSGGISDLFHSNYLPMEKDVGLTFEDVKGSDEAKEELSDIVEYLRNPGKFTRMNAKLPKGLLLTGPPGCGKTLMARALAGEAKVPFFYVSGSEFEEMLVGVGARRVRELFQRAKQSAPCIIFIDEIDAIGGRRDTPDNKTKMTLNQLLVELDGFAQNQGIVVIAATNLPKTLDPALTRPGRFDRQVSISLPDTKARREIIKLYLGDRGTPEVDENYLAETTAGFSGADIFNMVNSAAIVAIKKNLRKITMRMLEDSRESVMLGPERKSLTLTDDTRRNVAYHEAGHALVALYCPSLDRQIVKATLVPRGNALGMVRYMLKNELLISKQALETNLMVAMGGRAAEEIIFGPANVTQGAGSDFETATDMAETMISKYGMSPTIGPVSYRSKFDHDVTPETRHIIETEARAMCSDSYKKAKDILVKHKEQLHLLAQALLKYETLTLDEIQAVIAGKDIQSMKEKLRLEEEQLRVKEEEALKIFEPLPAQPQPLRRSISNKA